MTPVNAGQGLLMVNFRNSYSGPVPDPASLALKNIPRLFFSKRKPYGLIQLQQQSAQATLPLKYGAFGLDMFTYGNEKYSESQITAGWGSSLNQRISLGMSFHSYSLSINGYGSAHTVGISMAAHFKLSPEINWGFLFKNLNQPKIGKMKEPLPQLIITAVHFSPNSNVDVQVEWEQDTKYKGRYKFGFEVKPKSWLFIRGGYVSGQLTAGIGWRLKYVLFDYALVTHSQLGTTQWIGIGLPLGRN